MNTPITSNEKQVLNEMNIFLSPGKNEIKTEQMIVKLLGSILLRLIMNDNTKESNDSPAKE